MNIDTKLIRQSTNKIPLEVFDCGITDYRDALEVQLEMVQNRIENRIPNTVLLLEHHPTITLGANKPQNKLLQTEQTLAEEGIELVAVRRGGGTTAHNPGQIVIYPMIDINSLDLGISEYVRQLEQVGIELLSTLAISAGRVKGRPGLWKNQKKIAAIGVKIKKHVTYHGMAININNDLAIFEYIVPCGIENVQITSAANETQQTISMDKIKQTLADICIKHWT